MATRSYRFGGQMPASTDQIERARRRVRRLESAGVSRRQIAGRAGVAPSSVTKLMNDHPPRVSRPVVAALLAMR